VVLELDCCVDNKQYPPVGIHSRTEGAECSINQNKVFKMSANNEIEYNEVHIVCQTEVVSERGPFLKNIKLHSPRANIKNSMGIWCYEIATMHTWPINRQTIYVAVK
jgi:hypothetical protein